MSELLAKIVGCTMLIATAIGFLHNPLPLLFLVAVFLAIAFWINPRI